MRVELRFPDARSRKDRRGHLRPMVDGVRHRFTVAIAEVDHQDTWQRAALGVAAVSASPSHATDIVDEVERYLWSFPDVEILSTSRAWLDDLDG